MATEITTTSDVSKVSDVPTVTSTSNQSENKLSVSSFSSSAKRYVPPHLRMAAQGESPDTVAKLPPSPDPPRSDRNRSNQENENYREHGWNDRRGQGRDRRRGGRRGGRGRYPNDNRNNYFGRNEQQGDEQQENENDNKQGEDNNNDNNNIQPNDETREIFGKKKFDTYSRRRDTNLRGNSHRLNNNNRNQHHRYDRNETNNRRNFNRDRNENENNEYRNYKNERNFGRNRRDRGDEQEENDPMEEEANKQPPESNLASTSGSSSSTAALSKNRYARATAASRDNPHYTGHEPVSPEQEQRNEEEEEEEQQEDQGQAQTRKRMPRRNHPRNVHADSNEVLLTDSFEQMYLTQHSHSSVNTRNVDSTATQNAPIKTSGQKLMHPTGNSRSPPDNWAQGLKPRQSAVPSSFNDHGNDDNHLHQHNPGSEEEHQRTLENERYADEK